MMNLLFDMLRNPRNDTTRIREVCLGFTAEEESRRMREFFNYNNAVTLDLLQKRFAAPAVAK